ncbi:putative GMC oxidoreductase [Daldinia sp. FL1419]|nr:putative GMC oxidoreductase [Daldinia sp. FL1419]
MASTYDFVVVGSGPAGSAVATWLAKSARKPSVLLLEAGGRNDDKNLRVDGQRWTTFRNESLNWGFKTVPQEFCNNRELDYSRGLGLGGSSAVNFSVFTVGASRDYDEWAHIVGDEAFAWAHMQRRLKSLESFNPTLPPGIDSRYAAPRVEDHGSSGPLKTGFVAEMEKDVAPLFEAIEKAGYPLNPDHNSGNPIGFSLGINSSNKGVRSTAADLLTPVPDNLTIITDAPVQRVMVRGNKIVGAESNGKNYLASKEVILSTGSVNNPRILMHSGIGPRAQLEKYGIPVIKDVLAIGQGLRDHMFIPIAYTRAEGTTDRASFYGSKKAMADALEQWKKDGSGPWAKYGCQLPIGWFKLDKLLASQEYQDLPAEEKALINDPTIPHYELLSHFPLHWFIPDFPDSNLNYSTLLVFLFNAQSRGEITLQSEDPDAAPRIDPKFLATAFDRRAAIEALRDALQFVKSEGYARDTVSTITGPASESDEDLLEYWRQAIGSSWHMTGTVKMGPPDSADAAVDHDFRLIGFSGLRVADMSVVPVLASCHVQAVAYLTGITCAEKLIAEYNLA